MSAQKLKDKYEAPKKLHDGPGGQMERYKVLHDDIEKNIPKKAQKYLESRRDEWGYKELKSQYDRFMQGAKIPDDSKADNKNDPLSVVTSTAVKRAIIDTNISLSKAGKEKKRTFLNRIKKMFAEERHDQFDATGFQVRLQKDREESEKNIKKRPVTEKETDNVIDFQAKLKEKRTGHRHSESVDRTALEEEMRDMEKTGQAHIVDDEGFKQVKISEEHGRTRRKAQVEINREKAMERFFIEDNRQQFKGKEQSGQDDLSLAIRAEDGRTVELDLKEIRALEEYLEQEEADLDKAA
jgi:hypothetical protein